MALFVSPYFVLRPHGLFRSGAWLVRKLPSSNQVDVLFLYSEDGYITRGVSADQMETMIAGELPLTNEATENSGVDLHFNLVHVAEVGG